MVYTNAILTEHKWPLIWPLFVYKCICINVGHVENLKIRQIIVFVVCIFCLIHVE